MNTTRPTPHPANSRFVHAAGKIARNPIGHHDRPTHLPDGVMLYTESIVAASYPGRHAYALTHYITSGDGHTAVPIIWGCLFDRVITRVAPDQNEDLWRQLSEPATAITRLLTSARHDFVEAVAHLRQWLAVTGVKWLQGRGEALHQPRGLQILHSSTTPSPNAARGIHGAESFRLKAA
jgi:hypothetical protein